MKDIRRIVLFIRRIRLLSLFIPMKRIIALVVTFGETLLNSLLNIRAYLLKRLWNMQGLKIILPPKRRRRKLSKLGIRYRLGISFGKYRLTITSTYGLSPDPCVIYWEEV